MASNRSNSIKKNHEEWNENDDDISLENKTSIPMLKHEPKDSTYFDENL